MTILRSSITGLGPALLGLVACDVPPVALHRLYDSTKVVAAPELVGSWVDDDGAWVRVTAAGPWRMDVTWGGEEKERWHSVAYALTIDSVRFLDVGPDLEELAASAQPILPAHVFFRYSLARDTIRLGFVDQDGWAKYLEALGEPVIRQEYPPDPGEKNSMGDPSVLLLHKTDRLQQMVRDLLRDATVQWTVVTLVRQAPAPPD